MKNTNIDELKKNLQNKKLLTTEEKKILNDIKKNDIPLEEDLYLDIANIMIDNGFHYDSTISVSKELQEGGILNREEFLTLLITYCKNSSYVTIENLREIYNVFENKNLVNVIFSELPHNYKTNIYINNYIVKARKYYVDETAFLSSIISFIKEVKEKELSSDEILKNILNSYIEDDKKQAGIYKIPENEIKNISKKVDLLEERTNNIDVSSDEIKEKLNIEINKILKDKLTEIDDKLNNADKISEKLLKEIKGEVTSLQAMLSDNKSLNEIKEKLYNIEKTSDKEIEKQQKLEKIQEKTITKLKEDILKRTDLTYIENAEIENKVRTKINKYIKKNEEYGIYKGQYKILYAYYIALLYNNEDIYIKAKDEYKLTIVPKRELTRMFTHDLKNIFGKEIYLDLIETRSGMLDEYLEDDTIPLLSDLLKINPKYTEHYNHNMVPKLIEIFGIDRVAKEEENFCLFINNLYENQFEYYKEILDINPNFEFNYAFIRVLYKNNLYSTSDIALMDKDKLIILSELAPLDEIKVEISNDELRKIIDEILEKGINYKNITERYPKICRNLIYLINDKDSKITLDNYFSCSIGEQENIIHNYNVYKNSKALQKIKYRRRMNQIING